MSDALDRFEDTLVEICPECEGWADCCLTCLDSGVVAHTCCPDVDEE